MLVNFKKYMHNSVHRRIIVLTIFLLLSLLSVLYLWHFHTVYYNSEYLFHLSRIHGIDNDLLHGRFPLINWGTTVPYGTALGYYPWLTLFPLALLGLVVHNAVNLFYLMLFVIYLVMYFVSYCSYRTYEKSLPHDLAFAILYTASSIVYDWAIRGGDIGVLLAMTFLPMAWFGFLSVMQRHRRWFMLTVGLILVITSNVVTAVLLVAVMLILGVLNLKRFNLKSLGEVILTIVITAAVTSLFWLPDLLLGNRIIIPAATNANDMYTGLFVWFGNFYNYLYGLIDVVGLLSIINVRHKAFHLLDGEIWGISFIMFLANLTPISHLLVKCFPILLDLQSFYYLDVITHLLLTFIGMKWLTGYYKIRFRTHIRIPLYFLIIFALFTPTVNQIGTHFLFHNRPVINDDNAARLVKKSGIPARFNSRSFFSLRHGHINYDYAPDYGIMDNHAWDVKNRARIYRNGKRQATSQRYVPTKQGFVIKSPSRKVSIQMPILLYHHLSYRFTLNGKPLSKRNVNQRLTQRTHELVLNNLPCKTYRIGLRTVKLGWL